MIGFIVGFVLGTIAGVFGMALMCAAGQSDRAAERMFAEALDDVKFENLS